MNIYTKTGDKGETSLIGGSRVLKCNICVEAYGTVDEWISYIGLIRSQKIDATIIENLHKIQICLMNISSILANGGNKKLTQVTVDDVKFLENEIDKIEDEVEPLKYFVLPGGHPIPATCHIARTVCRRAERIIIKLNQENPLPLELLAYINRLSDYFFALARKMHKILNVDEVFWIP